MLYQRTEQFETHNEEVREVWESYRKGDPIRVPMTLGVTTRTLLLDRRTNPGGISFYDYFSDPELMLQRQLYHSWWVRHNLPFDQEMGLPKDGWDVYVDFQNIYEACWFGCPIFFREGEVPDVRPILTDDRKNLLFDRGLPDPFNDGIMKRNLEYFHYFLHKKEEGFTFEGLPINNVSPAGLGTDGPFTIACNLRGAQSMALDIYLDPDYVHSLLNLITEATIHRIRSWRKYLGRELRTGSWGFADDSIQLLSVSAYRDFVLPYHRKLVEAFSEGGPNSIHLCGDAQRHFISIRDELNVKNFDTGFPIDFTRLREELGADVAISGGPHISLLRNGAPEEVASETERILRSGILEGKKFVLREANNLAPNTPIENLKAMYETCRRLGRYR